MTSQKRSDDLPPDLTDVFEYKDLPDFEFNQKETETLLELAQIVLEKQNQTFNVAISSQGSHRNNPFRRWFQLVYCFLKCNDPYFSIKKIIDSNNLNGVVEIALSGKLRSLKIGQQKKSPFHYCVTESKFAFAELFLRFGSDVNQLRLDGKSVLIDAVGKFIHAWYTILVFFLNSAYKLDKDLRNERMVAYAILCQCDEMLTDDNGRTAFHIAANGGNVSIMKKLFEVQPLMRTKLTDFTGYSLILWSIEAKEIDMLKFLLSKSTAIDTS